MATPAISIRRYGRRYRSELRVDTRVTCLPSRPQLHNRPEGTVFVGAIADRSFTPRGDDETDDVRENEYAADADAAVTHRIDPGRSARRAFHRNRGDLDRAGELGRQRHRRANAIACGAGLADERDIAANPGDRRPLDPIGE